LAVNWQYNFNT